MEEEEEIQEAVEEVDLEEGDNTMADQFTNLCIRCGKQRVVVKTRREYINSSLVTTAITSCPDAECQKIVDTMLHKEKKVREKISEDHEREKILREKRRRRSHRRKVINLRLKK